MNETEYESVVQPSIFSVGSQIQCDEDIEVDDSFFDDEIDVVRAEYATDVNEPTISFNNCQLHVNMACIKKLPETDYVQFLINKTKKQFALLPCREDERDAFLWRTINSKSGKRQPRHITAHIFSAMLFEYMEWDINWRYKLIGKIKLSRGIKLLVFDLNSYKAYPKAVSGKDEANHSQSYLPSDWKGQFGLPLNEHKRIMEVATFKNYATISISDNNNVPPEEITGEKVNDHEDEITTS